MGLIFVAPFGFLRPSSRRVVRIHESAQLMMMWRAAALVVIFLIIIPVCFSGQSYWLNVLTTASFLAFGGLGVWIIFAIGRVNMGQSAFAMIGGYATAILSVRFGVNFWLCLPLSAMITAIVAILIGWPLLRLRGVYFAMVTLSLTEAVQLVFLNTHVGGISNVPRPSGLNSMLAFYLFSATLMLIGVLIVWRLSQSRLGRIFDALRHNEELAMSLGINVAGYRVIAFAICSAMGGITGACFAGLQQNIFPSTYTVTDSINFLLYCFLGGLSFIVGPVVGTFTLVVAFELLRNIQQYQALLYGILMIALMLFLPDGILSLPAHHGSDINKKLQKRFPTIGTLFGRGS